MAMTCSRVVFGALVVGAVSCRPPTEVMVIISTNVVCEKVTDTGIVVGAASAVEQKNAGTITSTCENGRVGSIVLVPSKERDAAFVVKVVTGVGVSTEECLANPTRPTDVKGERGCIIARRELGFIPQTPLTLPIAMHAACIGVICMPDQTCIEGGVCSSDKIVDPSMCAVIGGCDEGALAKGADGGPTGPSSSSSGGMGGMGGMFMGSSGGPVGGMGGMMSSSGVGVGGMNTSKGGMGGAAGGPSGPSSSGTTTTSSSGTTTTAASSSSTTAASSAGASGGAGAGGAPTTSTSSGNTAGAGGAKTTSSSGVMPDAGVDTVDAG